MTTARPRRHTEPSQESASFGADDLATRLQARLAALESNPDLAAVRSGRATPSPAPSTPAPGVHLSPGPPPEADGSVADLHDQLEVLRGQLEVAFDDVEARIAAAEARAEAADSRAQVASARAANILYAVDELAAELGRIAATAPADVPRMRTAVDKLRGRLQPT